MEIPYKVVGCNDETLNIMQDRLENTASIHTTTLISSSRRHCDNSLAGKSNDSNEEVLRVNRDSEEDLDDDDHTYIVDKIVRHSGSRSAFTM